MLKKLTQKRNKKGFTLVELIVVIAILGILMLIAVPRFAGFRENAAIKADEATAATIGKAAELYLLNNSEVSLANLKEDDLIDKDVKAQKKGKTGFNIETLRAEGEVEVYYEGDILPENRLYPAPAKAD